MSGIVNIIQGNKGQESLDPVFFGKLKRLLSDKNLLSFDIETGGSYKNNPFGIPEEELALDPHTGKLLLCGLLDQNLKHEFLHDLSERQLFERLFDRLEKWNKLPNSYLVGHNILGFDLPFIIQRAQCAFDMNIPDWLKALLRSDRVIDTMRIFGSGKFIHNTMSLTNMDKFWGRPIIPDGASFGKLWESGDIELQQRLMNYNMWNLLDAFTLGVFSGIIPTINEKFNIPKGIAYSDSEWSSEQYNETTLITSPVPLCGFITAPLPGLLANGIGNGGWGKINKEETKIAFPYGSGRFNPRAMMAVGFWRHQDKFELYLNPNDEFDVLKHGLDYIADHQNVFIEKMQGQRFFATMRASLYNAVVNIPVIGDLHSIKEGTGKRGEHYIDLDEYMNMLESKTPVYCGCDLSIQTGAYERAMAIAKFVNLNKDIILSKEQPGSRHHI